MQLPRHYMYAGGLEANPVQTQPTNLLYTAEQSICDYNWQLHFFFEGILSIPSDFNCLFLDLPVDFNGLYLDLPVHFNGLFLDLPIDLNGLFLDLPENVPMSRLV